jgi:hypothetical protein
MVGLLSVLAVSSTPIARAGAQSLSSSPGSPRLATHVTQEPPAQPIVAGAGKALSGESENVDPSNNAARVALAPRIAPADLERAASGWPMDAAVSPAGGLIINATLDSSITNNANAAAIRAMVNQAVAIYQSQFTDPITVSILFRYSSTDADGSALGNAGAKSHFPSYELSWSAYINALNADARTSNDRTANATLPASAFSTNVLVASAAGRAVGLNTPPVMFADTRLGTGGPYDGIVTLNSAVSFQFTRPVTSNQFYDALRFTQHEIDEVLGVGASASGVTPEDLFSWSAPGTRNLTLSGTRYFSIDGGRTNIVGFNQDSNGDPRDWFSAPCPQANPYVQNAFTCAGQMSDVTPTSPEGIALDVVGYDLGETSSVPSAPTNFTAAASGSTVSLSWAAPSFGAPTSYQIEAGSSSGLANLASFSTGSTLTSFSTGGVGNGTYYLRLKAQNAAGTSAASNEAILVVGSAACATAPGAPTSLTTSVSGGTVTIRWSAPSGGCAPTAYFLQAGSTAGSSALANANIGNVTSYVASGVGNGSYYIRVVAANASGQSAASNEVVATVGLAKGALSVTVTPNPTPFSGAASTVCPGDPNTWTYNETIQETNGVGMTVTRRSNSVDGRFLNQAASNTSIPARGSVTNNVIWCLTGSGGPYTVQTTYSGTDANGNSFTYAGPSVTLLPKGGTTTTFDGQYAAQVTYNCTASSGASEPCNRSFGSNGCAFETFSFSVTGGVLRDACGWPTAASVSSGGSYSGRFTGTASGTLPITGIFSSSFQLSGSDVFRGNTYRITIAVQKR